MLADIASGHVDLADVLFLLAAILFAVSLVDAVSPRTDRLGTLCVRAGLALVAVGWLVL